MAHRDHRDRRAPRPRGQGQDGLRGHVPLRREPAQRRTSTCPPKLLQVISGRDSMFPTIGGPRGLGRRRVGGRGRDAASRRATTSPCPSSRRAAQCQFCLSGRQYICDMGATIVAGPMIADGTWRHRLGDTNLNRMCQLGTFSEYIVVHEASLIKIDPWLDLRAAALHLVRDRDRLRVRGQPRRGEAPATSSRSSAAAASARGRCRGLHAGARAVIAIDTNPSKVERAIKHRRDARLRVRARRRVQRPARPDLGQELRRGDHHGRRT